MNTLKYALIGGNVASNSDGDVHYISPASLLRLYRIDRTQAVLFKDYDDYKTRGHRFEELKILRPRNDGNYEL